MKHKFTLRLFFVLTALLFSAQVNAQPAVATGDKEIALNLTTVYSVKVVQVSFNGNDGDNAAFDVVNAEGFVVKHMDTVELIKSPSYFTVDVSDLKKGNYTLFIKTAKKTYTSTISIK